MTAAYFGLFCKAIANSRWKFYFFPLFHLSKYMQGTVTKSRKEMAPGALLTEGQYSAANGHAG